MADQQQTPPKTQPEGAGQQPDRSDANNSPTSDMAEAVVVEDRAPVIARFYCHMCNVEICIPNTEFTCPLCDGGFVEEIQPPFIPHTAESIPSTTTATAPRGIQIQELPLPFDMNILRNELATLLHSRNAPNFDIAIDPVSGRVNARGPNSNVTVIAGNIGAVGNTNSGISLGNRANNSNSSASSGGSASATGNGNAGARVRPQNLDGFDNLLLNFLLSISGDPEASNTGEPPILFMGNLGDYAWGREGLDSIVTQLLNQMESSGPPPLPKWKIDEIPKVQVTAEEVEKKLQCSVCWEDFVLDETVRKLSCSHLYHEQCIVPWLDLHGTCPICRKLLDDLYEENDANAEQMNESQTLDGDTNRASNSPNASSRGRNPATGVRPLAAIITSNINRTNPNARNQQQQHSSNNVFGFDDMDFSNGDLD